MRRSLFLIASLIVSALFLWLALRDVPLEEIWTSIREANMLWILVAIAFGIIGLWTRGIRWRGLLNGRISQVDAFYILSIGMTLNQLPMRAGEIARSVLTTRSGVPFFTAATSIVVERLLDTLYVVIVLALALTQVPDAPPTITQAATLFGIAGVVALGVLLVFARRPQYARNTLAFFERLIPLLKRLPLQGLMENILEGIQPLARWRSAAHAIIWTFISWATSLAAFYALTLALGVESQRELVTLLSITMASFAIALPVTVASIGPFEGAVRLSAQAVGLSSAIGVTLGFVFHGVFILYVAIPGVIGLLRMGVSLGELMRKSPEEAPTESAAVVSGAK